MEFVYISKQVEAKVSDFVSKINHEWVIIMF